MCGKQQQQQKTGTRFETQLREKKRKKSFETLITKLNTHKRQHLETVFKHDWMQPNPLVLVSISFISNTSVKTRGGKELD